MMAHVGRKTVLPAVLAGCLSLALAACGSSSPSASGQTGGSGKSLTPITVATNYKFATIWPLTIGMKEGIFQKHGLKVTEDDIAGQSTLDSALESGSAQFGVADNNGANIPDSAAGQTVIKVIGAMESSTQLQLMVQPSITSIKQLNGKTLAVVAANSPLQPMVKYLLSTVGLPPTAVKFESIGLGPAMTAALLSNQVDGALLIQPNILQAEAAGKHSLLAMRNYIGVGNAPLVLAATSYLGSHGATAKAFMAGLAESDQWMLAHPAKSEQIFQETANVSHKDAVISYKDTAPIIPQNAGIDVQSLKKWVGIENKFGTTPELGVSTYYTTAYLPKAG